MKPILLLFVLGTLWLLYANDITQGLIYDKKNHPMTTLEKPGYLEMVQDPEFETAIRRITNAASNTAIKPAYSTVPAWNADETYLILYQTNNGKHNLYDGTTYAFIKSLPISPTDLEHFAWHPTDPDLLYYPSNKRLYRYHVSAGQNEMVYDFGADNNAGSSFGFGDDPEYGCSWDGNLWGFSDGSNMYAFDLGTKSCSKKNGAQDIQPWPYPSGTGFFHLGDLLDKSLNPQGSLDIENPYDHAGIGMLANGHDVHIGVAYDGSPTGTVVVSDITDGSQRCVVGQPTGYPYPPSGTHISTHIFDHPGFIAVSIVGNHTGATLLDNELLLIDCNADGKVCRVCHHRSWGKDGPQGYWAEPHAVASPSGTRIAFGSDWGGTNTVDTYVAELPAYDANAVLDKKGGTINKAVNLMFAKEGIAVRLKTIHYELPRGGHTKLEVYNATGAKVTTLVNAYLTPGAHTASWDTGRLGSGTYYCRLTQGNLKSTARYVIIY